jgi:hypothetical protein
MWLVQWKRSLFFGNLARIAIIIAMIRTISILRSGIFFVLLLSATGLMLYSAQTDSPAIGEPVGPTFLGLTLQLRLIVIVLTIFFLVLVYAWVRDVVGKFAGLLAVFLISLSPKILALGHLATPEMGVILLTFLSLILFLNFIRKPKLMWVIALGIVFGATQLIDLSLFIFVPCFILLTLIYILRQVFEDRARDGSTTSAWREGGRRLRALLHVFVVGYVFLYATYFALSWDFTSRYLSGVKAVGQNWVSLAFNPERIILFFSSEPLPALIIILLALLFGVLVSFRKIWRRMLGKSENLSGLIDIYFPEIILAFFILLYLLFEQDFNTVLPILYVLVAILVSHWFSIPGFDFAKNIKAKITILYRSRFVVITRGLILVFLVIWQIGWVLYMSPHFISDDRGQDLYRLRSWIHKSQIEKIAIDYYGPISPVSVVGEVAEPWWSELGNPQSDDISWLAVSIKNLEESANNYAWLENKSSPNRIIGTTIFIYELPKANRPDQ